MNLAKRTEVPMKQQKLQYTVYEHFSDVPKEHWDALCRNCSITLSYEFWKTITSASLNVERYFFILFFCNNRPAALVPCYKIKTDLAIFASLRLKKILAGIRVLWPNFLTLNNFECGSPVTINTPQFLVDDTIDKYSFLSTLNKIILQIARKHRCLLVTVRDFEDNHDVSEFRNSFKKLGFSWLPSLPNTYLDIKWPAIGDYHEALRSHYRYKLFKHLKISEKKKVSYQLIDDFSHLADELCRQWLIIHANAGELKREVLTPEFYREISQNMGDNSKALLFYAEDKLIAHALLLKDNDLLRWLYVGRAVSRNDSLYFMIVHTIIRTAIEMKVSRIEFGLTTYPIKQTFGATLVPIDMAIKLTIPPFNPFLTPFYKLLYKSVRYQEKHVFKS